MNFCIGGGAVLAGGALRDLDNGLQDQVKDLDIYVPWGCDWANLERVVSLYDGQCVRRDHYETYGRVGHAWIREIRDYRRDDGRDISFIEIDDPNGWTGFDFGICQIAYDGRQVRVTDAYRADKKNRTFTLVRSADIERSMKRWERLSQKYVGWTLVMSPGKV